ncbi:FAD-dependent oxidoreductase [Amycolatopsis sp. NPDC021455]|uniref:NAD(P)/FAD-dependent oxidoreductase n=1 Tax=Amycolatopsis sp. NPDC021455 TaxID=3154901 RepID=UPI0033F0FC9D
MAADRVVVVGASMAGLRAAEAVRKAGYGGEVVVIGDEPHMPYNRPPLSKTALGAEPADLAFRIPRHARDVTWRLGEAVTAADLSTRTVTCAGGEVLGWSGLVIASGLRPRRLPIPGPDRCVIRTLDDAARVRAALRPGARLVVVGAGFIGCEVAAAARALGAEVDVVAPESVPVERPLGQLLGAALRRRHEAHGVRFHLGTVPAEYRTSSVVLGDGTELPADLVIEAVGCVPATDWLAGTGLDLTDGVLCDNSLRAGGRPHVVACGDVARFPNPLFDDVPRRVEHWTMATDTAKRAGTALGRHLAGAEPDGTPFAPLPSFWSDQYDFRLQSYGAAGLGDEVRVLEGDLDGEAAVEYHRRGRLTGVVLIGLGARYAHYRALVTEGRDLALR